MDILNWLGFSMILIPAFLILAFVFTIAMRDKAPRSTLIGAVVYIIIAVILLTWGIFT